MNAGKQGSEYFSGREDRATATSGPEKYSDPSFSRAAWIVALAGFALTLAAFWPGYLSWDSAYQWFQARGGAIDPTHPPVMVHVWKAVRAVLPDPGGMLAVQAALWWSALAVFANALGGGALRRGATVALLGAWPPLFAVLPHLWKDVWMTALFAWAVAALAADLRAPRPVWKAVAFAAIAFACAFRFNALPAALPLLGWIAWRIVGPMPPAPASPLPDVEVPVPGRAAARRRRVVRIGALVAAALAVVQLFSTVANRAPGKDVAMWPALAMWDIAAVSIAEDRVLFPPAWVDPALTVADLRRDFQPYVNVPSFAAGQLKLNFYYDYTPAQFADLRDVWLSLPFDHPRAYLEHRAAVSAYLFGFRQAAHPDSLVVSPAIVAYGDNPPLAANASALHGAVQPTLSRFVDTPVFAAWPYLVVALALVVAALGWRRGPAHRELAGAVAASSLLLAAPLVLAAPSSDFRYLLWSVCAALLATALWFAREEA